MWKIIQIILILFFFSCSQSKDDELHIKPYKADLPGYQLAWNDEFDYSEIDLDNNWISQNGPNSHILCSRWRENASVKNGLLYLTNKKENKGGQEWTSASIWTKRKFKYGYFECRYKYAAATGTNNSFWLMTTGASPDSGKRFEIDINEGHFPSELNTNIHNHSDVTIDSITGKQSHPTSSKSFSFLSKGLDLSQEFHIYGLKWTPDSLFYYFDGEIIRSIENEICQSPAPVYLSEAIISWAGKVTDSIDGTSMVVDWVRIYQLK